MRSDAAEKLILSDNSNSAASENTSFLSELNNELHSYLISCPEAATIIVQKSKEKHRQELVDVGFDISPWPLVLEAERTTDFINVVQTLPRLIKQVLESYFDGDRQDFCDYLDTPAVVLELIMMVQIQPEELVVRYDLIFSGNTIKVIEVNAGSNLGGWELDWKHLKTFAAIKSIPSIERQQFFYRPVIKSLVSSIAKSVLMLKKSKKTGNILFRTISLPAQVSATLTHFIQSSYCAAPDYQGGQVFLCSDINKVEFDSGNSVYFEGQSIDAVVLLDGDIPSFFYNKLVSAYISKEIVFPDSPVHRLFGNKTVFALLHEEKTKTFLSKQQIQWIDKHIPWTARSSQKEVVWKSERYKLIDLLEYKKDQFVLKKSRSMQGKDVFIGKYMPLTEWISLLTRLVQEPGWIVQEFCPSDVIFAPGLDSVVRQYIPVWGAFGFGGIFGGSYARAMPVEARKGVVNLSVGAIKLAALEHNTKNKSAEHPEIRQTESNGGAGLPDFINNNRRYSLLFEKLMLLIQSDEDVKLHRLRLDGNRVPKFMQNYEYTTSAWPFIISTDMREEFNQFVKPLVELFYRSVILFFEDDHDKFSNYLNESSVVFDLLKRYKFDARDFLIRHDVVFSGNEFKLIEINVGSTVGGWQHDWISSLFEDALKSNYKTSSWELLYRNITSSTFSAIFDSIRRTKKRAVGNVILFADESAINDLTSFQDSYSELFRRVSPFHQGELFFFNDFNLLSFSSDGDVIFNNKVMDAVLLAVPDGIEIPRSLTMRLVSSYLSGKIVFPDNPIHALLGNKMMLALMHEPVLSQRLDAESTAFIQKYIPWTVRLDQEQVIWQGKACNLDNLIRVNKDQFVLKKSRSMQGKDVYIGRFMNDSDWNHCIDRLIDKNDWLIQVYCQPDKVVASSEASESGIYESVWGIYDLNNSYSGAFVRGKRNFMGDGIINSARGAIEFPVFEECTKIKIKIIL